MASASSMDRYQVQEYLAEGGMGAIYRGKHIGPRGEVREVVLKQLLPEFTQEAEFIDLFVREAKLSAVLDHPNIIRTTDLVTAGDDYFIVMEYLYGADLRTLLRRAKRRGQRLAPAAALTIMREVLEALAYAHSARDRKGRDLHLIHRDVSPSNILVSARGEVKLTDFGIAKAATHNSGLFYRVKGKVGYMSPEQAKSDPMDHRSDLFSVGVCLHEALTGERLYVSPSLTMSADELFAQPVPLVSRRVAGLPAELDALLGRALAISPDARYQSAEEFAGAIERIQRRHGLSMNDEQLTEHLRTICGPAASWREEIADPTPVRAGTEMIEDPGTELLSDDDLLPMSVMTQDGVISKRRRRKQESMPALGRLQHIELTSIVSLAASDAPGATPLVDLDRLGRGYTGAQPAIRDARGPAAAGGRADDSVIVDEGHEVAGEITPTPEPVRGARADEPRGSRVRKAATDPTATTHVQAPEAGRTRTLHLVLGVALLIAIGVGLFLVIGLTGPELAAPGK
jgi:serine/threonine protein kinase